MSLTIAEKKRFRSIAHALKPVVLLGGSGLTEGVLAEIGRALGDHELIKVRIGGEDREARAEAIASMADSLKAEVVQVIGKVVVLYRRAAKPDPRLSNVLRAGKME